MLPRFLAAALDEHLRTYTDGGVGPDAYVFTGPHGARGNHRNFLARVFRPAVRAALPPELAGLRFHDMRHTAAALLIAQGAHPSLIKARLGHASITTTLDLYGHMLPALDEAANAGLEAT